MNRMGLVLIATLSYGCDSTRTPTAPSSEPSPAPVQGPYSVSGVVADSDTGRPIENANVAVGFNQDRVITTTAADGTYTVSFSTTQPYANNLPNVLALLVVWPPSGQGSGSGYQTMVQEIPRGSSQIGRNVRLRPVRRPIMAGESMRLSIEPDSSHAFDWEYAPWELASYGKFDGIVRLGRLWESFAVSPVREGVLTVDVRSEIGGSAPFLWCDFVGCPGFNVQGPVSIPVRASLVYGFRIEIPRGSAPQPFVITTSLQ